MCESGILVVLNCRDRARGIKENSGNYILNITNIDGIKQLESIESFPDPGLDD